MSILDLFSRKQLNDIEQKALPEKKDSFKIISGDSKVQKYTSQDLLAFNRSYVYACNNKTAITIASNPLKLYAKTNGQKLLTPNHNVSRKQLKFINATKKKSIDNIVEIDQHPFLDLINTINPRMNYVDFASLVQSYLGLIGNAFVYVEKTNGIPSALYPLMSENVTVIKKENGTAYGEIAGYKVSEGSKETIYAPEDIIQFINYMPGNAIYGKGELESCISAAERLMYYDSVENHTNANNARPDFLVVYKNGIKEQEQKEITRSWIKKFGNPKNAGKPMIAGGDVDIRPLGLSPRDMQYASGRVSAQDEILAVYGVPEALVRLNSANLASSQSANQMYYQYTIVPKLTAYCEKLNEKLLPMYDDNLFCWFEPPKFEDPSVTATINNSYIASGVMTVNEAREQIGLEPIEEEVPEETPVMPEDTIEDTTEDTTEPTTTTTTTPMPTKSYSEPIEIHVYTNK